MNRRLRDAQTPKGHGGRPIQQRRLVEAGLPPPFGHQPIPCDHHFLGDLGVSAFIGIHQGKPQAGPHQTSQHHQQQAKAEFRQPQPGVALCLGGGGGGGKERPGPPELHQGLQDGGNVPDGDLAVTGRPGSMDDWHFSDGQPVLTGPAQQLGVEEESLAGQTGRIDPVAAKDLQRAVAISHLGSQQGPGKNVESLRVHLAPPRVLAIGSFAAGYVVRLAQLQQLSQVHQVELAVGIGEGDQLVSRGPEPAAQSLGITDILDERDDAHLRTIRGRRVRNLQSRIATAIVDNEDFVGHPQVIQSLTGFGNRLGDDRFFVMGGKYQTQTWQGRARHFFLAAGHHGVWPWEMDRVGRLEQEPLVSRRDSRVCGLEQKWGELWPAAAVEDGEPVSRRWPRARKMRRVPAASPGLHRAATGNPVRSAKLGYKASLGNAFGTVLRQARGDDCRPAPVAPRADRFVLEITL